MRVQSKILTSLLLFSLSVSLVCGTAQTEKMGTLIPTGIWPVGVAVDPSLNRTYILGIGGELGILDGTTNSLTMVETGIRPWPTPIHGFSEFIAVNPENHRVYLLGGTELGIFDGLTQTLVHRLPVEVIAEFVAVNATTDTIYITGRSLLAIVDGETLTTSIIELPIGDRAAGVACNAETNQIYVPTPSSLLVIDGTTLQVTARIELGAVDVRGFAINPSTNKLYLPAITVTDNQRILIVVDGVTLEVSLYPIDIAAEQVGVADLSMTDIAVNPASDRIYITTEINTAVSRSLKIGLLVEFDGGSNHRQRLFPLEFRGGMIAVNPESGLAYLVIRDGGSLGSVLIIVQVNPVGGANAE